MLFGINRYSRFFLQKTGLILVLATAFVFSADGQINPFKKEANPFHLNPFLLSAFRKPVQPNPNLNDRFKPPTNQLMSWTAYYLSADQRQAKYRENNPSFASEVVNNIVHNIISGKPAKPAAIPKF